LGKLVNTPYISSRAKRELVQVYLYIEEFDRALTMARENYEANRGNQFPIQAYLQCLLNSEAPQPHLHEIQGLIEELDQIGSAQSKEMTLIAKAQYEAKFAADKAAAYAHVDDAAALNQLSPYPPLAKFDIALRFKDEAVMSETLELLEEIARSRTFSRNTVIKNKAYFEAAMGRVERATKIVESELDGYPKDTIEKIKAKILQIAGKNGR